MLRSIKLTLLVAFAGLAFASVSYGQAATFASFTVSSPSRAANTNYVWNNSGGGTGSMVSTFNINFLAFGQYYTEAEAATGGAFPDSGIVSATCAINITSNGNATTSGGNILQPVAGSITITANAPIAGLTNLLTMSFSGGTMSGPSGGTSLVLSVSSPPDTLTYTSQFANFAFSTIRNYSMQATGLDNALAINNNIMSSWTTDFTQTSFAANFVGIPEPSSFALLGLVGLGGFYVHRRRKVKAMALAAAEAAAEKTKTEAQPSVA